MITMLQAAKKKKKKKPNNKRRVVTFSEMMKVFVRKLQVSLCINTLELFYACEESLDWVEKFHPSYYEECEKYHTRIEEAHSTYIKKLRQHYNYDPDAVNNILTYTPRHFYKPSLVEMRRKIMRTSEMIAVRRGVKQAWKVGVAAIAEVAQLHNRRIIEALAEQLGKRLIAERYPVTLPEVIGSTINCVTVDDMFLSNLYIAELLDGMGIDAIEYDSITNRPQMKELVYNYSLKYMEELNDADIGKVKNLTQEEHERQKQLSAR